MRRRNRLLVLLFVVAIAATAAMWLAMPKDPIHAATFDRLKVGMREAEAVAVLGRPPDYRFDLRPEKVHQVDALGWNGDRDNIVLWVDDDGAVTRLFFAPDVMVPRRPLFARFHRWLGL